MNSAASGTTTLESVILEELRTLQRSVNELGKNTSERLSTVEARLVPDVDARLSTIQTQIKPLFDNGQPGRCNVNDRRLTALEHWRIYTLGMAAGIAGLVTWLFRIFWKG